MIWLVKATGRKFFGMEWLPHLCRGQMMAWRRSDGITPISNDFFQRRRRGCDSEVLQDLRRMAGTPSPPAADLGDSSLQATSKSSLVSIMSFRLVSALLIQLDQRQ